MRHGHDTDPGYDGLILHLVWEDDREADAGTPTPLPNGGRVLTVAVAPALDHDAAALRELIRLGPSGGESCAGWAAATPAATVTETVRGEGRRRLAERAWGAGRLVELAGWEGAWEELLIRALRASAGRRRESEGEQRALAARIGATIGGGGVPLPALEQLARTRRPAALIEALRQPAGLGRTRAVEIGWNAVLPLLAAAAAAYGDREFAASVAALVDRWPAPRPYGRTTALAALLRPAGPDRAARAGVARRTRSTGGALYAQGLLHLQDLWCERGGCGVCPLSPPDPPAPA